MACSILGSIVRSYSAHYDRAGADDRIYRAEIKKLNRETRSTRLPIFSQDLVSGQNRDRGFLVITVVVSLTLRRAAGDQVRVSRNEVNPP